VADMCTQSNSDVGVGKCSVQERYSPYFPPSESKTVPGVHRGLVDREWLGRHVPAAGDGTLDG